MVALRLIALLLLVGSVALPAHADVFPYEAVGSSGQNNVLDSNASSCDSVEGCFSATGTRCKDNPNQLCNLAIVPAGRCSYGNLAPGLASCVYPHRAGRCNGSALNNKVGCLPTSGVDDTASEQCSGLAPGTCDLSFDKYGRAADPNDAATCTCTNADATTICGGTLSVCSDGDNNREVGGLGVGLGVELKTGAAGSQTFANMGPATTGATLPKSSPPYGLENPPVNFDPQRDAGSVSRSPQGTGSIHQARVTDARSITAYVHPTIANPGPEPLNVRKVEALGDSYWGDWFYISRDVSGIYNTHIVTFTCDPPVGWTTGTAVNAAGDQCYRAVRNGISFYWDDDLTTAQKEAYSTPPGPGGVPVCPPHCYKDFNVSTTESQQFAETGLEDPNAGIQLAIQSGEAAATRVAGDHDTIGVAAVTSLTWLIPTDLRCKMGGWGNAPGVVGRCSDGASPCTPTTGAVCAGEGGSCRACNGPFDAITNPLGLPIGYNTHGFAQLDLVAGQRIGGIAGVASTVKVPLFVVGTTGNAASDFRDIADEGPPDVDLAELGPVDEFSSFGTGVGAGGTFTNGVQLNIDEPCCGTGAGVNVDWAPEALGTVNPGSELGFSYRYGSGGGDIFLSDWALTYDKGPGPDGIPGCIGDNVNVLNGVDACNQKLGFGAIGLKTNPAFATGQDDRALQYEIGAVTMPASSSKFQWRAADAGTVAHFALAQNPPTSNSVAAFTLRDLNIFAARSADVLVKVNTTQCPLRADTGPACATENCDAAGGDADLDGVCQDTDNCDLVANPLQENSDADTFGDACDNCAIVANEDQADGAGGLETVDGVGDVCDNCPTVANANQADVLETSATIPAAADAVGDLCDNCTARNNPRVAGWTFTNGGSTFFAANQWATLTGGQRDDDHDGYGNQCDADFTTSGGLVGTNDLNQYRASNNKSRSGDTCGTNLTQPCARYDLDTTGGLTGTGDLNVFRFLNNKSRGPRCTACTGTGSAPLPCTAGTTGSCVLTFSP